MGAICAKQKPLPVPPPAPAEDPNPDPIIGLTQRQRILLKQSWNSIIRKWTIKEAGVKIVTKCFSKDPHAVNVYHDFENKGINELRTNPSFRAYAVNIAMRLSAYIECSDDPDILIALIYKHAHTQYSNGFTVQDMEALKEAVLEFVMEECDQNAKDEIFDAWDKLLTFHNDCFKTKVDELQANCTK